MATASKILTVGGVLNLALAFVLGFAMSRIRLGGGAAHAYLQVAHRVALWEGFMLLGLNFAVGLSQLSPGLEIMAAGLLVASSVFQDGASIINWLQDVNDEFRERSPGFVLATTNALLASAGLAILLLGVFRAL